MDHRWWGPGQAPNSRWWPWFRSLMWVVGYHKDPGLPTWYARGEYSLNILLVGPGPQGGMWSHVNRNWILVGRSLWYQCTLTLTLTLDLKNLHSYLRTKGALTSSLPWTLTNKVGCEGQLTSTKGATWFMNLYSIIISPFGTKAPSQLLLKGVRAP